MYVSVSLLPTLAIMVHLKNFFFFDHKKVSELVMFLNDSRGHTGS